MAMKRGIDKAVKSAVEELKTISVPVNGKDDIARVASISANNDEVGELIAEAMEKVFKRWSYNNRRVKKNINNTIKCS